MTRIKVDIKWDPVSKSFFGFDQPTGNILTNYSNLDYGGTDIGTDDPTVSVLGFSTLTKLPIITAKMVGFCDVP